MQTLSAVACVVAALSVCFSAPAMAQETWPTKPLRLIIPFPAGGSSDQLGRLMAKELGLKLGQPVQVENTDSKGTKAAAGAAPDGYTLVLSGVGTNAISHALNPRLDYDSLKDFVHISQLSEGPNVLVVGADSPLKSLQELITVGKAQPGKLTYAQVHASSGHLAMELLKQTISTCVNGASGTRNCTTLGLTGVPFTGAKPALDAVMDNKAGMMFTNLDAVAPHVRSGKLRALAVTSLFRNPQLPDVPSISEVGYPGFKAVSWVGISAPAGTPAAVVGRLEKEMDSAFKASETRKQLEAQGLVVVVSRSAEYTDFIRREMERWRRVVKVAGIQTPS
ncbi:MULTISPECIES: tripartite tricarboxylate transporter substrate binding protein [unclassified Acidovorax]|uniref:Bug family tripartite tricarboxylate transporter substrate binding protein n=1 Tax=unclassified Acidovorax TaxID=2684926 RepID=UPI0009E91777|nr:MULTISPECIES: tripartite tricarboxylate transporter substrate binding protein [unclassified Acidovorax]MBD9394472.1 tripartite tricarboxylate transporter substrate binding protein [Acidovorax sp. ACV01]